jgi:hypothetical protein
MRKQHDEPVETGGKLLLCWLKSQFKLNGGPVFVISFWFLFPLTNVNKLPGVD